MKASAAMMCVGQPPWCLNQSKYDCLFQGLRDSAMDPMMLITVGWGFVSSQRLGYWMAWFTSVLRDIFLAKNKSLGGNDWKKKKNIELPLP